MKYEKANGTFEEFKKLPRKEQNVRSKDLSDHDKILA